MTLYQQIKRISRTTLKHYREDLTVHDRRLCAAMTPGTSALWTKRECGTHFIWVSVEADQSEFAIADTIESLRNRLNHFDAVAQVFGNEDGSNEWYMLECVGTKQNGTVFALDANAARDILLQRIKSFERLLERKRVA